MTAALEGGEWSAACPGRTLPPGKTRCPFYRRLDGPQGWSGRAENLVPTRILSRTVHSIVSRYTDWTTWPTHSRSTNVKVSLKFIVQLPTVYFHTSYILSHSFIPFISLPFPFWLWYLWSYNFKLSYIWMLQMAQFLTQNYDGMGT